MNFYLLVYNRATGHLARRDFGDARDQALKARFEAEQAVTDSDTEVVVVSAASFEDLKRTHSRYFHSLPDLARAGADRLASASDRQSA